MQYYKKVKISNNDFEKLKHRKIGEGRDSVVYCAGKGLLYKVYKDESNLKDINQKFKLYKKDECKKKEYNEKNCYIDADGVRIYYRDALLRIIDRQEKIIFSSLPVSQLFINNKFSGCVIRKKIGVQIHYIFPFLTKKRQIKILKYLLMIVKELTDNYIYPLDLANSPIIGNHSNILVNLRLRPVLIDLDGNSTVYRENYNEQLLKGTFESLNMLFLELIYGFNLKETESEYDIYNIRKTIGESGVESNLIEKLIDCNANYDDLNKLTLQLK